MIYWYGINYKGQNVFLSLYHYYSDTSLASTFINSSLSLGTHLKHTTLTLNLGFGRFCTGMRGLGTWIGEGSSVRFPVCMRASVSFYSLTLTRALHACREFGWGIFLLVWVPTGFLRGSRGSPYGDTPCSFSGMLSSLSAKIFIVVYFFILIDFMD